MNLNQRITFAATVAAQEVSGEIEDCSIYSTLSFW